jgi:acetyl-CoA/propionyl-CoA carboxylase biotin carboxyl carrier protein
MSLNILWQTGSEIAVQDGETVRRFSYVRRGSGLLLTDGQGYWQITNSTVADSSRRTDGGADAAVTGKTVSGRVTSQMPGKVLEVRAAQGDNMARGDVLLVLEAMKMEHSITAPCDGVVKHLVLQPGERVMPGELLAEIEPAP